MISLKHQAGLILPPQESPYLDSSHAAFRLSFFFAILWTHRHFTSEYYITKRLSSAGPSTFRRRKHSRSFTTIVDDTMTQV